MLPSSSLPARPGKKRLPLPPRPKDPTVKAAAKGDRARLAADETPAEPEGQHSKTERAGFRRFSSDLLRSLLSRLFAGEAFRPDHLRHDPRDVPGVLPAGRSDAGAQSGPDLGGGRHRLALRVHQNGHSEV